MTDKANATRCSECAFTHAPPDQLDAILLNCVAADQPFLCHVANDAGIPSICRGYLSYFRGCYRAQAFDLVDVEALPHDDTGKYAPGLYLKINEREEPPCTPTA